MYKRHCQAKEASVKAHRAEAWFGTYSNSINHQLHDHHVLLRDHTRRFVEAATDCSCLT